MDKLKINWNLLTVLLSIIAIIISVYAIINQGHKDYYLSRIEELVNVNNDLKAQLDPEWHKKFNEQRNYYESELSSLKLKLTYANQRVDSALYFPFVLRKTNKNQVVLNEQQIRVLNSKLSDGKRDAELLKMSEEMVRLQGHMIINYKSIEGLFKTMIKNQQLYINRKDEILNEALKYNKKDPLMTIFIIGIVISLLIIMISSNLNLLKSLYLRIRNL